VWFVSWPELRSLFDTGSVTMAALEALPSLVRGWAWSFEEQLHPNGIAPDPAITMKRARPARRRRPVRTRLALPGERQPRHREIKFTPEADDKPKACKAGPGKSKCPPGSR
jgi:hypothetical protein